jgi:hypothetical protein
VTDSINADVNMPGKVISLDALVDSLDEAVRSKKDPSEGIRQVEGVLEELVRSDATVWLYGGKEIIERLEKRVFTPRAIFLLDRLGFPMGTYFQRCCCNFRGPCLAGGSLIELLPYSVLELPHKADRKFAARFLACLLKCRFGNDGDGDNECAVQVVDKVLLQILVDGRTDPFKIMNEGSTPDEALLRDCYIHCLRELLCLRCEPLSSGFHLAAELFMPLEPEEISRLVVKVMDTTAASSDKKLNVCNLGTVISALVACFEEGERALKWELEQRLSTAIVANDERIFKLCLFSVRSMCSSIRGRRPAPGKTHYGEWFKRTFGQVRIVLTKLLDEIDRVPYCLQEETSLLVVGVKKPYPYHTFMQLLYRAAVTAEDEDRACLISHLSNKPFLPSSLQLAWQQYVTLARAKLKDITSKAGGSGQQEDITSKAGGSGQQEDITSKAGGSGQQGNHKRYT